MTQSLTATEVPASRLRNPKSEIRNPKSKIAWGLFGLSLALLLPRLFSFVALGLGRIVWPWQFDFDEGINLNTVTLLAGGHNIYRHNGPDGFLSSPYPPLFYLLNVPAQWLAGPSFAFGRALSFAATLAIAVLLAYIVWKISANWGAGALAGILWLSLSPVIVWSTLYKQDMPALALGLAGLAWALTYPEGRRVYVAAVLFALAFFTKQSALSAAAATTLWLIIRNPRTGLRFLGALALMIPVPFLLANVLLRGGLYEHLVGNHTLPWSAGRLRQALRRVGGEYWPLVLWGGAAAIGEFAWLVLGSRREVRGFLHRAGQGRALLAIYAFVGVAASLVQSGYEGANYNHLLDGLLPLCGLAGLSVGWLLRAFGSAHPRQRVRSAAGLGLTIAVIVVQLFAYAEPTTWYRGGTWPSAERASEMTGLANLVAKTPGDAYSEDAYLLLRNGKRVLYDDPSTFVPLAQTGGWDGSLLTQSLRDRRFGLVLLMKGSARWTPDALAAFEDNYTLKFPGSIETYEPVLFPTNPQYSLNCTLSGEGDSVALRGYSLAPGVAWNGVKPGDTVRAMLHWRAARKAGHDYASYVHLVNEKGEQAAGRDNPATGAARPTSQWQPGAAITDTTAIPLPAGMSAERYRLVAGMYRVDAGAVRTLPAKCSQGESYGEAVSLGWVDVRR
jgi:hypothetical protein